MYRSVFIFVLLVLSASAMSLMHQQNPVNSVQARCSNEHGVSRDWIDAKMRNFTEADITDRTTKCFVACMWRGRGMLNEDGTINAPLMTKNLPTNIANREGVVQAFTDCSREKGDNVCDTVSKTVLCLYAKEAFNSMHPVGTPFETAH